MERRYAPVTRPRRPLALMELRVRLFSNKDDMILDLFA
jgi:DNA modification methylase